MKPVAKSATAIACATEGYAYRTAFAQGHGGEQPGALMMNVEIRAPGSFVTKQPCVEISLIQAHGPGRRRDPQTLDVFVADLDRLVATLQKAIEIARTTGVLEAPV